MTYAFNNDWADEATLYHYIDTVDDSNSVSNIAYDNIGNTTSIDGNTLNWKAGRQLDSVIADDNSYSEFFYNANGQISRIDTYNEEMEYENSNVFVWDGDNLISKCTLYSDGSKMIARLLYDSDGETYGYILNDSKAYLYRKNLQGDITGIINAESGVLLAECSYDAYGNMSVHGTSTLKKILALVQLNTSPILYRGYVYSPIGSNMAYYLGSRFYMPRYGRFLNADKHFDTGTGVIGTNMFAYCNNNPVSFIDPTGEVLEVMNFLENIIEFLIMLLKNIPNAFASLLKRNNAIWPIENEYNHHITSHWGFRFLNNQYEHHQGIDIRADVKTPVLAIADGIIVTIDASRETSQGIYMVLQHKMDDIIFYTRYMHLYSVTPGLAVGESVSMGEQIALSGNTSSNGYTVTQHLHFQIQFSNSSSRSDTINPYTGYHRCDTRYDNENPNAFYILSDGLFIFNKSFDPEQSLIYLENNHWSVSIDTSYIQH